MEKEERKLRLKTLTGHLLTKYDLDHHSISHICFKIKPEDILYIVNNWTDVLNDSNLFISISKPSGLHSQNTNSFKVDTSEHIFIVSSKEYYKYNRFSISEHLKEIDYIKITVSCETILTFEFNYKDTEQHTVYSFRND